MSHALVKHEPERTTPNVAEMLQAVVEKGVTQENVSALKEMVELYKSVKKDDAEKEFAKAFVELQAEMPSVRAVKPVPNRDGSVRYNFAPYEEIMAQVSPLLKKHGFTVTFSTDYKESRLVKTCTLQHIGGHKTSNSFAVRIGSGPPGASETQADGAAATYAKRGALCDALNIVVEHDTDANAEGAAITAEQVNELKGRVTAAAINPEAFLKFASAKSFEEISAVKYPMLDEFLRKKENRPAPTTQEKSTAPGQSAILSDEEVRNLEIVLSERMDLRDAARRYMEERGGLPSRGADLSMLNRSWFAKLIANPGAFWRNVEAFVKQAAR